MYAIVYLTMNVMIEKIKIKAIFNNDAEINCISKKLINVVQLFVYQNINIIMINVINERVCFLNVCEVVFINIKSIIVLISVFVIKRFNYELFLNVSFNELFA